MLSVLRSVSPVPQQQQSPNETPRVKFSTILGFGPLHKDVTAGSSQHHSSTSIDARIAQSLTRKSVDVVSSHNTLLKKNRRDRSSVTEISFIDSDIPAQPVLTPTSSNPAPIPQKPPMTSRRVPIRVDGQDGPWAVSVAETPHDATSYSLYIKTPTHNLTLTRTALEIVELHDKLRDTLPTTKLPALPIDASVLPSPPKRKSAFLNTLSRFASPSSKTANGRPYRNVTPSGHPTPVASPTHEINDPFSEDELDVMNDVQACLVPTNSTITGLAAYLTTISNDPSIRQARVWKRFVRVRTDDLQSVRVERAIKRVRSDLAAHVSPGSPGEHRSISQVVSSANGQTPIAKAVPDASPAEGSEATNGEAGASVDGVVSNGLNGVEEEPVEPAEAVSADAPGDATTSNGMDVDEDRAPTPHSPKAPADVSSSYKASGSDIRPLNGQSQLLNGIDRDNTDDEAVELAQAEDSTAHAARIPRSQSAEPTSRISRIFSASTVPREITSSQTSVTGDDSSVSTTGRRVARKKRSKSMNPESEKKKTQRKVAIDDFEMMRVLGKGCAGKVLLVRHKPSADVYALKAITKRHVLAHQELQHTLTEQAVLKRMAAEGTDPFVVKLWWSFHDKENLFLVMDFHPGGDLATQLARWGRLGRDRARFYAAEIVEGVEGLHAAGVIYRDLKPENILIGADGHIVLTDFGLSKEFPRKTSAVTAPPTPSGTRPDFASGSTTSAAPPWMKGEKGDIASGWTTTTPNDSTSTFCGTAEYLAPEVIQGLPYSYEVDWWSFGTMLYEMLTGITPFWANNHSDMYYRVLQDELQFPEDRTMDQDTKSLIRGLLQRNPALRMKEPRIKKHPYFSMIDWTHVYFKRYIPPYIPPIDPSNASDTQNFDDTFLDMEPVINDDNDNEHTDTDQDRQTDTDRTDGEDSVATPSQSRSPSVHPVEDEAVDVFDGYSFKGRHSVILDEDIDEDGADDADDDEEESILEEEEEEEEETAPVVKPVAEAPHTEEPSDSSDIPAEVAEYIANAAAEAEAEEGVEPKTPEARPATLPEPSEPVEEKADASDAAVTPRTSHEVPSAESVTVEQPVSSAPAAVQETKPQAKASKPASRLQTAQKGRNRREKSGIPALDRDLSDAHYEDVAADREEDDEWDFVETNVTEEHNGAKATSLFARGVVDRYKLAVFRKSTPRRSAPRTFSGMSTESDLLSEPSESPTPSEKQRRGRTPGLTFRKHPKQFLRHKDAGPTPRSSSTTAKSLNHSTSLALSASSTVSSAGLLTPSPSGGSTLPMSPSLKSKESAISMGSPSESSDQSVNETAAGGEPVRGTSGPSIVSEGEEKQKNKVLKKYKEGAEKVLSIFQSSPNHNR